jgi:uncharacterized protein (TIGR02246 family)
MRTGLALLFLILCAANVAAVAHDTLDRSGDELAINQVAQKFIQLRDDGNEAGLSALLTESCDQRLTSGRMRSGREAVLSGSLGATQSQGGQRVIALETIRFLGADVAIADGSYDSLGRADGTDLHMRTTMVFWRINGEWLIEAIRNVRLAEAT